MAEVEEHEEDNEMTSGGCNLPLAACDVGTGTDSGTDSGSGSGSDTDARDCEMSKPMSLSLLVPKAE